MADTFAPSSSSPSCPTASSIHSKFHVFINHRGLDSKKNFASHIHRHQRFQEHGLNVFLDKYDLQVTHHFPTQIQDVIRTASVHVAIFSPRYADSVWCLRELVYMLESRAPIIPVFYHVDPADLRRSQSKRSKYDKGLRKLELRHGSDTTQKWRDALSRVADISGLDLKETCNGDEGELVDKIVELVLQNVKNPDLYVGKPDSYVIKYPVGLKEMVEDFENKMLKNQQSSKAQVVGILGMGGAGKTTLSTKFFNRQSSSYKEAYFLDEVRKGKDSLSSLQSRLMKGLTKKDCSIESVREGRTMLRDHLCSSNSKLIVLDDVDDREQVNALLPDLDSVVSSNSFILITSRNKDVLTISGVSESSIYYLTGLPPQHSRELFCLHAFRQSSAPPEFDYLVDKFVTACDRLPLSLEVLGAHFYRKDGIRYWEDQFERIKTKLPDDITKILIISYEALEIQDKEIFLDIACFFIGENKDMAIRIWDGSGWGGSLGFLNLQNRCLVKVDKGNVIAMHDHLRDLGRQIAGDSRYVTLRAQNIYDLMQQSSEIAKARGIRILPNKDQVNEDEHGSSSSNKRRKLQPLDMSKLRLLDAADGLCGQILQKLDPPNLIWLRWDKCPYSSLPSRIRMKELRVLQVHGHKMETLWRSESQAPAQLRELMVTAPLSKFPESIGKLNHLERIYVNLIGENKVRTLSEEFCNLQSLSVLELLNFKKMKSLPEAFGCLTKLQHIDLSGCLKLKSLPKSFGSLIQLKHLNLCDCINLIISRETIGDIATLEYINLAFCKKIEALPPQIANQESLEKLYLEGTYIKELTCLQESFERFTQLSELTLGNCSISEMSFKRVAFDEVICLNLQYLDISSCDALVEIGTLPNALISLKLRSCSNLRKIEGLCDLTHLQKLNVMKCNELAELPSVEPLVSLEECEVSGCKKLKTIRGLEHLTKLRLLNVNFCPELEKLSGVEHCISLKRLSSYGCRKLEWSSGIVEQLQQRLGLGLEI